MDRARRFVDHFSFSIHGLIYNGLKTEAIGLLEVVGGGNLTYSHPYHNAAMHQYLNWRPGS